MADRAAVSLDQTASPHPPLPRQQRQRDPPPALRRDDRLRPAAHRRPPPLRQDLDPPLHRSGRPEPLRTPPHRRHRQTPARQPKPPTMPKLQKSAELQLSLSFPGQPCRKRAREPLEVGTKITRQLRWFRLVSPTRDTPQPCSAGDCRVV